MPSTRLGNTWSASTFGAGTFGGGTRGTLAPGALIVWAKSPVTSPPRSGTCTIALTNVKNGDHYRLYAFLDDKGFSSNWVAADLTVAGGISTLDLIDSGGTLLPNTGSPLTSVLSNPASLSLCVGLTAVTTFGNSFTYPIRHCHQQNFNQQLYFALANLSATNDIEFDNAYQIDHYDHDQNCPACMCSCLGKCMPMELCLTLFNDEYCSNLHGQSITLNRGSTPCTWQSDAWTCGPYVNYSWKLIWYGAGEFDNHTEHEWLLVLQDGTGSPVVSQVPNYLSTCDPLSFVFDPYTPPDTPTAKCCEGVQCADDDLTCFDWDPSPSIYRWKPGSFYGIVTEGACGD